ncbi:DUF3077 domain-containing protein [Pseudomonas sp. LS1212]|uniref:DUF3077 domain-containing protein n=1 Tax=Pseudomonas sp. LS1212 TaxID=2972478 RepID=UPI00215C6503|nr:DUF3077 domain-containing protein [Pseudomonas sp. LS1212]UVJ43121.1 DUF3077 domain-containing protein [Pseudomonas sp. LS1212]
MIKIVPDPPPTDSNTSASKPAGTLIKTVNTPFGTCDAGHEPLFAVCAGINAEDALVHASLLLKSAGDCASKALDSEGGTEEGLLWSTMHSIEAAKALVDAVVDGAEVHKT